MISTIRNYARRTYLINKRLQTRFIAGFSAAVFLGYIFNLFVVYFLIDRELTWELYKIHLTIRTTSDIAVPIILKLGAVTVPSILTLSAVIGYFLTRRIEIPLLTFKNAVREAAEGDFRTRLPGETPTALPEGFNAMNGSIGASFASIRDSAAGIERAYAALGPHAAPVTSKAATRDALKEIAEAREKMSRGLSRFKV